MQRTYRAVAITLGALSLAACGGSNHYGQASTPLPSVSGPLAVSAASYPFGAADHTLVPENLAAQGYVEEEYIVSGKANVYDWPAPGPAVVRTADAPYATRVLVRRPVDSRRFSGNVVVELLNASNLFDLNIGWGLSGKQFVANGDVWVGVTSKPVTADSLKKFSPQRYATLNWANPLPLDDPRNCQASAISTIIAGDSARGTENGLVWDIYSQVGQWLRSADAHNPLRPETGFKVQHLYGFGYSQSGGYLYTYINAIHPLDVQRNGAPIYDGYIVAVAGGAFAGISAINQCAKPPALDDPRRQFSNVGVPIMHVMSQSDYLLGIASRRPDSDVPADRFRHYEMAGAGHATPGELNSAAAPADILGAGRDLPPVACNEGPRSRFPSSVHFDALWRNLDLWVRNGVAPPHADPIEVVDGKGRTDQYGNLLGGVRSTYLDVPTSTWTGSSTGASFCFIAGHEIPLAASVLQQLYPSQADYVGKVRARASELVAQRFLTEADARDLVIEAQSFDPARP